MAHLRRCVELAEAALEDGDETRHPEFEIARWSATNLTAEERRSATVYTSGEHCPMCSAAHACMNWAGSCTRCPRRS